MAGIFAAQSGLPLTPTLSRNPANTTTVARPNCVGDANLPRDQRTVDRWFDVSAFAPAALYTYGNCGRKVLRAPGLVNLNLLIARSFQMRSKRRLELRGEFFNATNAVHLGRPNAVIDLPRQAGLPRPKRRLDRCRSGCASCSDLIRAGDRLSVRIGCEARPALTDRQSGPCGGSRQRLHRSVASAASVRSTILKETATPGHRDVERIAS